MSWMSLRRLGIQVTARRLIFVTVNREEKERKREISAVPAKGDTLERVAGHGLVGRQLGGGDRGQEEEGKVEVEGRERGYRTRASSLRLGREGGQRVRQKGTRMAHASLGTLP
jgi:hypothetical protein